MNKQKNYVIVYTIASILTLVFSIFSMIITEEVYNLVYMLFMIINVILALIFYIKIRKNKIKKQNILLPIIHIIFLIVMILLSLVINSYVIVPYIHFAYYMNFVLISDLMLNAYTILCLSK